MLPQLWYNYFITLKKHNKYLLTLGLLGLTYWVFDAVNIVVFIHRPTWMLWYSSSGLLLTSIALITESIPMLYSMFCALFLLEALWNIDFIHHLIFRTKLLGVTDYLFSSGFSKKDFFMSFYHVFIAPNILIGMILSKKIYQKGWIGASIYAFLLITLSYVFSAANDKVNCVHDVPACREVIPMAFSLPDGIRLTLMFVALIFLVYIPTNLVTVRVGKKLGWKLSR